MIPLRAVPFHLVQKFHRSIRKWAYTRPRPTGRYIVISKEDVTDLEAVLGKHSFAPNWEFSYHYKDEDLNQARVIHYDSSEYPELDWWQVHIRGYDHGDEWWLQYHFEPEPTEHPKKHITGVGVSQPTSVPSVEVVLETNNIPYEYDTYE